MIKWIDTNQVTPEMFEAFRNAENVGLGTQLLNVLEAAPEAAPDVEPVYFVWDWGNGWRLADESRYNKAADHVRMKYYTHPPHFADVVERIRALLKVIPEYASVNGHQLIYDILRRIEGAK